MCPTFNRGFQAAPKKQQEGIHDGNTFCLPREQHFKTVVLLCINLEEEIELFYSFRTALIIGFFNCSLKGDTHV